MHIDYRLDDGSVTQVEVTEEVAKFIIEDDRLTSNADRRQRYGCPYHYEMNKFEGDEYAHYETPERILIRKEENEHIRNTLSFLSDIQLQRLCMKADGLSMHQIAEIEEVNVNAVRNSLLGAVKKFKKYY